MSLAASFLQSYTLFFFPIRPGILISEENNHMSRESDHLASPAAQESRGTRRDWRPSLGSAACQCQDASFKNKNCCSQKLCWSKRDCTRIWNHLDRESFAKKRRREKKFVLLDGFQAWVGHLWEVDEICVPYNDLCLSLRLPLSASCGKQISICALSKSRWDKNM